MSEWIAIAQWQECQKMARPGIIFELRNTEGQSLFTPCVTQMPATPFDWKSPPVMFRVVAAPRPQHSEPMPAPRAPHSEPMPPPTGPAGRSNR